MCIVILKTLVLHMNNHICYSTCDSVQSIESMVYSDDVQEGNGSIFKPFWGVGWGGNFCLLGHRLMSVAMPGNIQKIAGI